ncbi:MAG: J domain-containing protein [Clostridiales bacterium]|nr:J domain-containing protein [Clostridiales bacterium]
MDIGETITESREELLEEEDMKSETTQQDKRTDGLEEEAAPLEDSDELAELEYKRNVLHEEKKRLETERREFERERREFALHKKMDLHRLEQEKQLFEMKWKLLEEELRKLVADREQFERQRKFHQHVQEHERWLRAQEQKRVVQGDGFFVGVKDSHALKKRYKDLLKIYHPDNLSGDVCTIQEINRAYDKLCNVFSC